MIFKKSTIQASGKRPWYVCNRKTLEFNKFVETLCKFIIYYAKFQFIVSKCTWSLWLMLSHITTWHERLPRVRSFLCYSSLKPKISPSNTLRFQGSLLPRPAFHSFLWSQDWLMTLQGSDWCCVSSPHCIPCQHWTEH